MTQSARKQVRSLDPLDKVGWLSGEPREVRDWVAASGTWRRYAAGTIIYLAGDPSGGLYGLANGTLEITFPLDATEAVSVHRAEPGFWIGESACLAGVPRSVSLASVDDTLVFHVPSSAIERRVQERPDTWRAFYRPSHMNGMRAVRMLAEALALPPGARFCQLLIRLSASGTEVIGNQESLGALVGLRHTTAKRLVHSLVAGGAIRSGYGRIIILDRALLETIAHEDRDIAQPLASLPETDHDTTRGP